MGFFKKQKTGFHAFAEGQTVAIEKVPDEIFSTKMMGDGIAIISVDGRIYAPCAGEVTMVMENTKHALGIRNADGIEILLHIGLETVYLEGEGFDVCVNVGDHVNPGDLLLTYDKQMFKEKGIQDISMMVIVEPQGCQVTKYVVDQNVVKDSSFIIEYKV